MTEIILALDTHTCKEGLDLVNKVRASYMNWVKIGQPLFLEGGPEFIKELAKIGMKVFLDLKWNDTPHTITNVFRTLGEVFHSDEIQMVTVMGEVESLEAAIVGRGYNIYPKILSVPYLTSQNTNQEFRYAKARYLDLMRDSTIPVDGFVVPSNLLAYAPDNVVKVVPGIRTHLGHFNVHYQNDDHMSTMTPGDAVISGADYIVIGRPITLAKNPKTTCYQLWENMNEGFEFEKTVRSRLNLFNRD